MINGFFWLIEHEIAGMGLPNGVIAASAKSSKVLSQECQDELNALKMQGISAVVSLTERALDVGLLEEHGLKYLHLPVPDMTAPTPSQTAQFLEFASRCKKEKRPIVVHCLGGTGRTGTMLACYLVAFKSYDAESAIRAVRLCRPGAIETEIQAASVKLLEHELNQESR